MHAAENPGRGRAAKARAARAKAAREKAARERKRRLSFEYRFPEGVRLTQNSEKRLDQWYRDAKYGAFIHWGVYSMLEGQYRDGRGKEHRYSEWIRFAAKIPNDEYHALAKTFNPVEFDADEWVTIFKEAGIRYVVITSKHHDGFCLFKSGVNDFNIVNGTPFGRDVIKELTEACHKQGLKMGVYYSHAQDWDEPDAPFLNPRTKLSDLHPDLPADFNPDMDRYLEKKSLKQVEELVTNYELDLVWFDTPAGMTPERARRFRDLVRKHRPDCVINSRIINRGKDRATQDLVELFDYVSIGDKEVPDRPLPLYFESPDSVSTSYAYKKYGDVSYHSVKEMIHRLVHTICSNGNYLLNNGPLAAGTARSIRHRDKTATVEVEHVRGECDDRPTYLHQGWCCRRECGSALSRVKS